MNKKSKSVTMFLSIIPGAAHMYLSFKIQGVQLMSIFFLSFFIADFFRTSVFMVVAPIVWFYSLFDALDKLEKEAVEDKGLSIFNYLNENLFGNNDKSKILGYSLIFIGFLIMLQKVVFPIIGRYIDFEFTRYIQTLIAAIVFIFGGIKLVRGSKK